MRDLTPVWVLLVLGTLVLGTLALVLCFILGWAIGNYTSALTPVPQTATPTLVPPMATPTLVPPTATVAATYPLAGDKYLSPQGEEYSALWTPDGRLWQPYLPPEGQRRGHEVSLTIVRGTYYFYGVSCRLHLDPDRNGQGAKNPMTVGYGNGLFFEVTTPVAWGIVICDPTHVTGFSIQWHNNN